MKEEDKSSETGKLLSIKDIFKNVEFKPIDMKEFYKNREKEIAKDQKRYKREVAAEEKRLKSLACPCCKSKERKSVVISKNNGIIGPGYHSHILQEYYVCQNCGVMFVDLNKKAIKYPKDNKDYFL
jgi:transposase-like protein